MSYINFKLLEEKDIRPNEYLILQAAYQNSFEDTSEVISLLVTDDQRFEDLINSGYLKYIKGTKKQNQLQKLRIDKKGKKLLEDVESTDVTEEDLKIADWLINLYKKEGKEIGNKKKTKEYIANFRINSGINKNKLAYLCQKFLYDNLENSNKLEYVFFKPKGVYNTRFDINESWLYRYYEKNKEKFDKEFEKL